MYTSLAVTCHLHFWHNGLDLLGATAVTREWNEYQNKSLKVKSEGENSDAASARDGTRYLLITSLAPYHWAVFYRIILFYPISCERLAFSLENSVRSFIITKESYSCGGAVSKAKVAWFYSSKKYLSMTCLLNP